MQRGFIQIPFLIAIIVATILGGGAYVAYEVAKPSQNASTDTKLQATTTSDTSAEIEQLREELAELRQLQDSQPKVVERIIERSISNDTNDTQNTVPPAGNTPLNLPALIQQWRTKIASVECDFRFKDTNELYAQSQGSGILWAPAGALILFTNQHVVTDDLGYAPNACRIVVPGFTSTFTVYQEDMKFPPDYDFAMAQVKNPDNNSWQTVYNATRPRCSSRAQIGEKIVILGYPGIGAVGSITATEGIISGYDGDYYITSAKVEQGASGGAAVLVDENCLLGISTFARVGQIEALARVLDINVIYNNL